MPPLIPPEEIGQLMRFVAEKAKNVKSPMNVKELCTKFKEETGTLMSVNRLVHRVRTYRNKIYKMNQFDMVTKVKMIFALSASIDGDLLIKLRRVADVKVDDQQRIIRYKQKDGGLELSGRHSRVPMKMGKRRDREMIQLLAEKAETTDTPISVRFFMREFKEKTGCTDSINTLEQRYQHVRNIIYQSSGIDKNTKIKMMFITNVKLSDEILKELLKDADVEVDEEGRITKYKSNDGSLELEGSHERASIWKSVSSYCYEKANKNESENDDDEDTNCQTDYEKHRIDLVRFLIQRTKHATSPLSINNLAMEYKKEFKSSGPLNSTITRIHRFRQHINKMDHFDTATKVKMLFALSVPIDAELLKKLQKHAVVELDEQLRIKKYSTNDGTLKLHGDHSPTAKIKSTKANRKKSRVVNDSSESEEDDDDEEEEEDSSETDGSDEEGDEDNTGDSGKSSSPLRKRQRIKKSTGSTRNILKKRAITAQIQSAMSKGKKRARISYSSSETSEDEPTEEDDDEESEESEDNISMASETHNIDNGGDDFDFDPMSYHQENERNHAKDMDHETTQEENSGEESPQEDDDKESAPSDDGTLMENVEDPTDIDYEPPRSHSENEEVIVVNTIPVEQKPFVGVENPLDNNPVDEQNDVMVLDSAPVEQKPQGLLTISGPVAEEPTTSIKELLILLRGPVMAIRSPSLYGICAKFDTKIQELANGNQQMLVESIHIPLDACLFLLLKHAALKCPPEVEATSLKNFLLTLQANTCHINHPSMESFHQKLQTKLFELSARDESIPINILDRAMDNTLHMLDA